MFAHPTLRTSPHTLFLGPIVWIRGARKPACPVWSSSRFDPRGPDRRLRVLYPPHPRLAQEAFLQAPAAPSLAPSIVPPWEFGGWMVRGVDGKLWGCRGRPKVEPPTLSRSVPTRSCQGTTPPPFYMTQPSASRTLEVIHGEGSYMVCHTKYKDATRNIQLKGQGVIYKGEGTLISFFWTRFSPGPASVHPLWSPPSLR